MKLNIKDIGDEGIRRQHKLDASKVHGMLAEVGVEPTKGSASLALDLVVTRVESTVFVRGSIIGEFQIICGRCLGPALVKVDEREMKITYLPAMSEESGDEELSLDDLDTYSHDGVVLDLDPLIREALLLSIPITPVCSENCKGICMACGADLNAESCECPKETSDSPWAHALGRIKISS